MKRLKEAISASKIYERGAAALIGLVRARPAAEPRGSAGTLSMTERFCDDCGLQFDHGVSEVSVGGLRASLRFFSIDRQEESDLCVSCVAEFLADAAVKLRGEAA